MSKEKSNIQIRTKTAFRSTPVHKVPVKKNSSIRKEYTIEELLKALQVYQVALEKQNEELRMSQDSLEKERVRFSSLFNLAPVSYVILNRLLNVNECNDTGIDLFETERSNLIGKKIIKFISPENHEAFYSFISGLIYSQKGLTCELKFRTQNGIDFYGLVEGNVINNSNDGEPTYYLAILDVTEKKVSELEQRDVKERLEMALRASATGTLTIHVKSMQVMLDNFTLEIFGLRNGEFDGTFRSFLELVYIKNRKEVEKIIWSAITNRSELSLETQVCINEEIRDVEIRGHVTGMDGNLFFAGVITDVTMRKRLEEEAAGLKAEYHRNILNAVIEAQESERMRIGSALHDSVGQLLYATSLNIENSGLENEFVKNASKLLNEAIRETRNISFELAPSILSDYGLEVALKEMIKRIAASPLKILLKISGIHERFQPTCELFIFRVVQELLNNIVKHSKASEAIVEITRKKKIVTIRIKDNGKGMRPDKDGILGTGLSSIRNRIEVYKGSFNIRSEKNVGTEIEITFPVIKNE